MLCNKLTRLMVQLGAGMQLEGASIMSASLITYGILNPITSSFIGDLSCTAVSMGIAEPSFI